MNICMSSNQASNSQQVTIDSPMRLTVINGLPQTTVCSRYKCKQEFSWEHNNRY